MSARYVSACDECGWTSTPAKTQPLADWGYRQHSCDLHRIRQARAARVADRKAASGPEAPCDCKTVHHDHGTRMRYTIHKCRCRTCRDGARAYEDNRRRQQTYGRWNNLVDAEPVRAHLRELMTAGMGWKRIARAAGLGESTVYPILYGKGDRPPRIRVRPHVADAILAVTLDLAGGAKVDGTGTRRRLQALVAIGWSQSKLADRIGWQVGNLNHLIHDREDVTVTTERAVSDLYDQLWNVAPPQVTRWDKIAVTRARRTAAEHGWVPPLAWDDDTIDDPDPTPHLGETAPNRGGMAKLPPDDEIAWLIEQGESVHAIAARFGVKAQSIERKLLRARQEAAA